MDNYGSWRYFYSGKESWEGLQLLLNFHELLLPDNTCSCHKTVESPSSFVVFLLI